MNKNKIIEILEESNLKPEQIDEVMIQLDEKKELPIPDKNNELVLKNELDKAETWQEKAKIAARIISYNLEN